MPAFELLLLPPMFDFTGTGFGTLESSMLWFEPSAFAQIAGSRLAVMTSSMSSSCMSTSRLLWPSTNFKLERPPQTSLPSVAR